MALSDRIALIFALAAVLAAYFVSACVFENMAHLEDEMAFVWQAQAAARGALILPSPPEPDSFMIPFVIDYQGQRFGKYPLGWPALLSVGVKLYLRNWINPFLAGMGVWLTYLLGKRIFGPAAGLLAAGLTLSSPFFLMNTGSLLSHPLGLVLSAAAALAWLDAFVWRRTSAPWLPVVVSGAALGALALTRPLTAVGVGLPFALHGLALLLGGSGRDRKRLLALGAIAVVLAGLHWFWQFALTGDPFLNPYTLWWEYDRVGFGPGVGKNETGHTLLLALGNTGLNLWGGVFDLFGWGPFSWLFLPFGLAAVFYRRARLKDVSVPGLLITGVFLGLVLVYMAYWIGSVLFGPRYYFEALYTGTILSGAGIALLAGWPIRPEEAWSFYSGWRKLRPLAVTALLAVLLAVNLFVYTPMRLSGMHALYGVTRAHLAPLDTPQAQELAPAVLIVQPRRTWTEYGTLIALTDPFLDTPFLVVLSHGPQADDLVAQNFPGRRVFYYHPDEPGIFIELP